VHDAPGHGLDLAVEFDGLFDGAGHAPQRLDLLGQPLAAQGAPFGAQVEGQQVQTGVRLQDLVRDPDISANLPMKPGDILMIPESWF
jgi:hypothetical protein